MNIINNAFFLLFALLMLSANQASAADKDALARAQYMLRQMSAEKNQLKATNQKISEENRQLVLDLKKLQKKYDRLSSKSKKNKTALTGRIEEITQKYQQQGIEYEDTKTKLAEMTKDRDRLHGVAVEQTQTIDLCVANNKKLYDINHQLLVRYEDKSMWDALSQAEPLTGLTQVDIENLVDDYQYRLDDLRIVPEQ